ncbi:NUDIX domain-containing protein [Pseudarthrobacter phenanthrenivorans]|uniref:NUDIX domain-containing protein n=1 Tax=Pseudarthrobacter phenanthrenivorans TaxID=361575 RepID=UPI0034E8A156
MTGYLENGTPPIQQAADELIEETGLQPEDLLELRQGPDVVLNDDRHMPWMIYTFIAVTNQRRLKIDWEHDSYRWTPASKTKRFGNRVSWLDPILIATGHIPAPRLLAAAPCQRR